MSTPPHELLERYWGYREFRGGQRELIDAAVGGQDVLGLLPTGGGKSLCYQIAGLARGGLTLVISPLVALMADQVAALQRRGISATLINSTLSQPTLEERLLALQQ
jgi:ATP-dependent DNA helicase RecQ